MQPISGDWFWEGNVQGRLAVWLRDQGWEDVRIADTASRERGVDILARQGNATSPSR